MFARFLKLALLLSASTVVHATPDILLEACNLFDSPSKRMQCLRAATQSSGPPAQLASPAANERAAPLSAYSAVPSRPAQPAYSPPTRSATGSSCSTGSSTCYVGPRGGTYTLTRNGKKNYGGC